MSRHIARITTILALLATTFLIPVALSAQSNTTESPYSRFGLGRLDKQTPHALRGMGGLTTAIRDNMIINPANPASYTAVDSMTFLFDFGLSMGMNMLTEAGKRDARMVGNFDYATALIPLGKHFAASAGLVPYSTVGYRYGTRVPVPNTQDHYAAHAYKGQGNLQEVYLGFAWKVLPYWSLGVNASYLFGNLQHERRITYDIKESLNPTFLDHLRIRSLGIRIGSQGIIPISTDGHKINIGFTYEPKLPMWSRQLSLQTEAITGKGAQVIHADTISSKSLFARPHVFSAGIAYQIENKLIAGADVKYSRWGEALANNQSLDYQGVDQWQVALGMSWVPNDRSSRYGQRIAYRAGLQGENAYLRIPNSLGGYNSYYQIGANLGLGLPLVDKRSHVDVNLGYSYLRPSSGTGLAEHYLTLGVALRFNEAWFKPIKLD
ncbi:hypothetical protein [Porphyromonas asaccharolytica]|uniref:hypothetical protein n=1 Tax=Porphyromonas asaccharolytica TaxID=28123 RepID=UPI0001EB289D|nr:hypothetical protein [Porphyromonas asaccharolytica]EFR33961.1 hypothetical protein HMPREF9294_1454 [Porphyromonas asaccharolytica PR426713P-I]